MDIPTEITEVTRAQQMITKAQKEKEEYEEAYLTRLPVTKAEKHRQRKLTTLGMDIVLLSASPFSIYSRHLEGTYFVSVDILPRQLLICFPFSLCSILCVAPTGTLGDEITSFGNISALSGTSSGQSKGKKRKSKGQGKSRGSKKRKFH